MNRFLTISITSFVIVLICCKKEDEEPVIPQISAFDPASGQVGIEVSISGKNFGSTQDGSTVMFNGAEANITSYSSTLVKAIVPSGATTGPISLKIGNFIATSEDDFSVLGSVAEDPSFYFGADLSYVNQVLDHGGEYRIGDLVKDPYEIFGDNGTDMVRLRLWHNPSWTKEVYEPDGDQLYHDILDVAEAIDRSKKQGMKVLLDFHYSDFWADPGRQEVPAAWINIKNINDLRDSVYNYTLKTLTYLDARGLMPEFVQIGNEINCGMLYEYNEAPVPGFPSCNSCDGQMANLKTVLNAGIKAVRDGASTTVIKPKVILHVADPENIGWWFDNITSGSGSVKDFDIIGFSYYPIWHTGVSLNALSDAVANAKTRYGKDVMILETAYPWTTSGDDQYNNIFGGQPPVDGFPYTPQGQYDMLTAITQELLDGGGTGIVYWEPAWITSSMRDPWGTGSSWENCAFFDFDGSMNKGMEYINHPYER